jgi:hypothetical protein
LTKYLLSDFALLNEQIKQKRLFSLLLILACLTELLYLLLVACSAWPTSGLSSTPLAAMLFPSQIVQTLLGPLVSKEVVPSQLLAMTLLALIGIYAWAILLVHRYRGTKSRRWFWLLLGSVVLFGLTLLLQPMLFSDDVFTYMFVGRILAIYSVDPINTAPIQFLTDPYLPWVISGRMTTNIYGPLWYCISALFALISNSPVISLLLFKGLALLTHLVNSVLTWAILAKIAPARRFTGTLLYAWNPLALIELAGSGHSEGILLTLLFLAIWLHIQGKGRFSRIGTLLLFGLAMSASLIVLLLIPLYLWYEARSERNVACALWRCCRHALIILLPFLGIFLPFWRGVSTFFAITSAIDMEHFVHSPAGLLVLPIRSLYSAFAQWANFPSFLQPITAADMTLRASATFIFMLIYLHILGQLRRAPVTPSGEQKPPLPGFAVLLSGWAVAVFWYLILVSGWFWPWYVLWLFWVVVLRRVDVFTVTILILSGTALFIYPFVGFSREPLATYQVALIFGIPLLYLIVAGRRYRQGGQERIIGTSDSSKRLI